MAIIITKCPHCHAENSTLKVMGASVFPVELWTRSMEPLEGHTTARQSVVVYDVSCGLVCQGCHKPISAVVRSGKVPNQANLYSVAAKNLTDGPYQISTYGFSLVDFWPKPAEPHIPAHLPREVERALLQAERNYATRSMEEAAALMYRRSLELSLKDLYPTLKGSVAYRTKQLVKQNLIPPSLGDWADEIRDLGNDAAHEQSQIDTAELSAIRGFADALLRYLYTLPAEIADRRKTPQSTPPT